MGIKENKKVVLFQNLDNAHTKCNFSIILNTFAYVYIFKKLYMYTDRSWYLNACDGNLFNIEMKNISKHVNTVEDKLSNEKYFMRFI